MRLPFDDLLDCCAVRVVLDDCGDALAPAVEVELPDNATIDDVDEVLDYFAGRLDWLRVGEPSWSVEITWRTSTRGAVALVVPDEQLLRATRAVFLEMHRWRKPGDAAQAVQQLRRRS